jgi:cystathionine beta-lyase/cystathionine gamma-synthase
MPVEPVWGDRYPDPGMIRLSVGFEPFEELSATISEALDTIS